MADDKLLCPWRAEALIREGSLPDHPLSQCAKDECAMWGPVESVEEGFNSGEGGKIFKPVIRQGCRRRG